MKNFKPSMTLKEFASTEGLDLDALRKAVRSTGLKSSFTRYEVCYYHISGLRYWLKQNYIGV